MTIKELFKIWSHVAANSFGGPAGQIAVIHKLVVEDKKIIDEKRFLHALNFCMLLPGPEAQQLATYMGWLMRGWLGGLIAGGLFILPGFLSILALSYIYVLYQDLTLVEGIFYGIKPAIIAIVLSALIRIGKKSLVTQFHQAIAAFGFFALFFLNLPFPAVVIGSGIMGALYGRFQSHEQEIATVQMPSLKTLIKTLSVWLLVWFTPIFILGLLWGAQNNFHQINLFFSKMSLVTFGGAYAALSYVAQQAVEVFQWLKPGEMLDGLALAETTPGPLIQVVQYVGFMAAYRFPEHLNPLFAAFVGSVLTTWMTFTPCFLFIFSFAPFVEFIRGKKALGHALTAITAAVVGVILNLSVWFVLKAIFTRSHSVKWGWLDFDYPALSSIDVHAAIIGIVAIVLQFKFKKGLFTILGVSTALGLISKFILVNL